MTPSDEHEAKRKEERRREFLERCAVAFTGGPFLMGNVSFAGQPHTPDSIAAGLVENWSALWDAIEADAKERKEKG